LKNVVDKITQFYLKTKSTSLQKRNKFFQDAHLSGLTRMLHFLTHTCNCTKKGEAQVRASAEKFPWGQRKKQIDK